MINKRWYDSDPILKEALELLRLQPDNTKSEATDFLLKLQEQVAGEVIDHVYEIINTYQGKGNRWYDNDPMMLKGVELLRLQPDSTKSEATDFLLKLQEQVAGEVIDHVYDIINTYQGKGNRWYDNDPMMLKGVELLRNAPANIQRVAALKLLIALEQKSFEGVEI